MTQEQPRCMYVCITVFINKKIWLVVNAYAAVLVSLGRTINMSTSTEGSGICVFMEHFEYVLLHE